MPAQYIFFPSYQYLVQWHILPNHVIFRYLLRRLFSMFVSKFSYIDLDTFFLS